MFAHAVLVAALLPLTLASPLATRNMHVLARRSGPPARFSMAGAASPDATLNLRVALTQSNPAGLEDALYDVSTPSSANYGNHLTKEEAAAFVAPTKEATAAVTSWLNNNGVNYTTLTPAGDWLSLTVPVSQANELFGAQFNVYTDETTGQQTVRTMSYAVPQTLAAHLTVVYPTTTKGKTGGKAGGKANSTASASGVAASCANTITPACLQSLYGIPTTPATQSSNQLGVSGFIDQFANQADLKTFLTTLRPDLSSSTTFSLQTLDGGENSQTAQDAGTEANLDTQYTVGLATGVPTTFISVGEKNQDGDLGGFLDIMNFLLNENDPPAVLTTSYGDNEDAIPVGMADNLCNAVAQLGARGVSVLFASGDGGVSGSQAAQCTDFVPTFPSGCPYLTSVGATTGNSPETAASFSAGGFSNYFGTPSYQATAVSTYLNTLGTTNKGLFNASGRGYPDVSTQGVNFEIVVDGSAGTVDGTSCASPTFASVIALLNDQLVAAGKSTLGFLNPWLYSTAASALTDITSGDNPGCNTNGFPAVTGWDAVTGLGTPNFAKLQAAAGL
ncbi:family S53 protease-like protein [Postia placenta Mad-698-R]|nr:family S53 protease-like protein [Postia placenta Mad-698-R]